MAQFEKGDVVLVNGNQVATIHTYDEDSGRLVLSQEQGGGEHLIYGPIQSYRLQHLVQPAQGSDERPETDETDEAETEQPVRKSPTAAADPQPETPEEGAKRVSRPVSGDESADEFTTLDSL